MCKRDDLVLAQAAVITPYSLQSVKSLSLMRLSHLQKVFVNIFFFFLVKSASCIKAEMIHE